MPHCSQNIDKDHSNAPGVLVVGAGGHGKVVVRTLQEAGFSVVAVLDDNPLTWGQKLAGIPIVSPQDAATNYPELPAVIGIGDNATREKIAGQLQRTWLTVVHPQAYVDPTAVLGPGTVVFAGAVVQPDANIGQHAIVNTGACVDHDCLVGNFAHLAPGVRLAGNVSVGEGGFLGIGASVIPGVQIGAWTTVGAGASVIENLPPDVVAVGVPARCSRQKSRQTPALHPPALHPPALAETVEEAALKEKAFDTPPRVYLSPPHMSPRERELLLEAFDSNWIAPLGPQVDAFEQEFAHKVDAHEAVALSSGTAALHLSLLLSGVERGDEVFTSSLTFAATANAITYVGAEPVFIDSNQESWNMDPDLLGEALQARAKQGKLPKAVISVDLYGQCAEYDRIVKICQFYEVPLIEDAAEALGATYHGKSAGTFGSLGIFSFNGNKIITTSGGGMLVTNDASLAQKARFLATQARDPAPHYQHSEIGYNYRMSNLLAAVGRGQLSVLEKRVHQRRANFAWYRQALADLPGICFMPEIPGARSTRWLTCVLIDQEQFGASPEDIRLALEYENIEARPLWKPMHLQPVFAHCTMHGGAVSEQLFKTGLCLPSGSNLSQHDRERVAEVLYALADKKSPHRRTREPNLTRAKR